MTMLGGNGGEAMDRAMFTEVEARMATYPMDPHCGFPPQCPPSMSKGCDGLFIGQNCGRVNGMCSGPNGINVRQSSQHNTDAYKVKDGLTIVLDLGVLHNPLNQIYEPLLTQSVRQKYLCPGEVNGTGCSRAWQ